jgi:hypothetical protein
MPGHAIFYLPPWFEHNLGAQMQANSAEVLVVTPEQFMCILQDKAKDPVVDRKIVESLRGTTFAQYWNQTFYPNVNEPAILPAGQLSSDLYLLARTLTALGVVGTQVYTKSNNGKTYLIFKGYSGLRNALQGTRYLATNPKIIQLGLGAKGLQNVAKGGVILGMVVSAGIEITDFILNDQKTMTDLAGSIGFEFVKSGLASLIGYGVGAMVGSIAGVAVLPLGVMVGAAFLAGWGLNKLDQKYQVKDKVLKVFNALPANIEQGVYELHDSALRALEQVKRDAQQKLQHVKHDVYKEINQTIDAAARAVIEAIERELASALRRLLQPGIR